MNITEIQATYLKGMTTKTIGSMIVVVVTAGKLIDAVSSLHKTHALPLLTIKATDQQKEGKGFVIYYIFGVAKSKYTIALALHVEKDSFPSIVTVMHEANGYEQEVQTFFGLQAVGNPSTNPLILHENWPANTFPLRKDFAWNKKVPMSKGKPYTFQEIGGEGIYQIPVGPVHAGIIEPGHFRFSVIGEMILSLQPQLGYVHKGSEKLFEVLPLEKKIALSEHISGDMSFAHSLAFCQALESLSDTRVPVYAKYARVIYSELERIANHVNDVGFILNDTAFAFGGSNGMRLKEIIMQLNERMTGSRFLRGVNVLGGIHSAISEDLLGDCERTLQRLSKDFTQFVDISEDSETVMNRLRGTGIMTQQVAKDHGVVGMAARMVGLEKDARVQYPHAGYEEIHVRLSKQQTGDVYARFQLRIDEVFESIRLILSAIERIKKEKVVSVGESKSFAENSFAVGISEGWRGEIVYFVKTDQDGVIDRVGVRDPSFLNWPAVPYAVIDNIVPDFPLINKSFNLSYSGFDR